MQLCTEEVLNTMAGEYTCGARINWLINTQGFAELDACRRVAGDEFPCDCGPCNPDTCWDITNPSAARTVAPTLPPVIPPSSLYCFPDESGRVTYSDMWDGSYKVQVKEGNVCGPGDNRFSKNTVSVLRDTATGDDKLVLQMKKNSMSGVWEASEVRIVNSNAAPFKYGNYTFHVESVAVKNGSGQTTSNILPANIVLGLFSWDPTERYDVHENWNHEVDVEVSRWGNDDNADTQFLMQPPGSPQMYRFYSGPEAAYNTYDQSNHWHSFRWLPNQISWLSTAGGGQSHLYKTKNAVLSDCKEDLVQCLPADVEIRINLWNMNGQNVAPKGLNDDDYVEVVIGDFSYEEAGIDYAEPGDFCSKHCQCEGFCVNGRCAEVTAPTTPTTPTTNAPAGSTTLAPSVSPTLTCADREGWWRIGRAWKKWCKLAARRGNNARISKFCQKKNLFEDCPVACGVCSPPPSL